MEQKEARYREIMRIIDTGEQGGRTQIDLFREHGVNHAAFYKWRANLRANITGTSSDIDTSQIQVYENPKKVRTAKVRTVEPAAKCVVIVTDVSQLANILKGL